MDDFYENSALPYGRIIGPVDPSAFEKLYRLSQCPECKNILHKNLEYIVKEEWWHDEAEMNGEIYYTWCQCANCKHFWNAGHSQTLEYANEYTPDGDCDRVVIREENEVKYNPSPRAEPEKEEITYIAIARIDQLKSVRTNDYDLKKLIRLCEEINSSFKNENYLAEIMLIRAILDHIPPIFGVKSFFEVANNYNGAKSFKESMEHLEKSARKIADAYLHGQIRKSESLPNQHQINFSNALDVLLAEIIRLLS